MTGNTFKEIEMNKELNLTNIISLQKQLEDAIETRELFLMAGDWNMVSAWDEQLEFITEKIKNLGNE